ncbi:MAG: sodium:solute symporter family protein [bacterium]|nr:sodium:solute symporter family protein [bacterium]
MEAGLTSWWAGLAYVLFLVYAVLRVMRKPAVGAVEYLVAGRRLTLPAFVATLVSTWYGGILGVGEYAWRHGLSNWLVFGVPYYICAALFAFLLAARARRSRLLSIPDLLEQRYGRGPALLGAGTLFVMTAPAAYVLMLGVLVQLATGWPLWLAVSLGSLLSVAYVFRGGLKAVVDTDRVQFVLMFAGFLVLVPVCMVKLGGWGWLRANVPATHLAWDGGLGWQAIFVWYFIALSTLVEPAFYQRCYAAQDEKTARRGILISIAFWIFFDFLTTTAGLYARALMPELAEPVRAFPELAARVLPGFWQGVFTVGLLATIMSTIDSYAFIAAVTLGRDLIGRWRGYDDERSLRLAQWCLAVTAAAATALALAAGSVVTLWKVMGSVGTPVLLLPLALAHTGRRASARRAVAAMAGAGAVSTVWLLLGRGAPWHGIEAIFPGLLVSAAVLAPAWRPGARKKEGTG